MRFEISANENCVLMCIYNIFKAYVLLIKALLFLFFFLLVLNREHKEDHENRNVPGIYSDKKNIRQKKLEAHWSLYP